MTVISHLVRSFIIARLKFYFEIECKSIVLLRILYLFPEQLSAGSKLKKKYVHWKKVAISRNLQKIFMDLLSYMYQKYGKDPASHAIRQILVPWRQSQLLYTSHTPALSQESWRVQQ